MHSIKHTDEPSPDGTGYNDFPKEWREITEKEFAQSMFFHHSPEHYESRTILRKNDKPLSAKLFWFYDGTGIGICNDFWGGRVSYYAFGCEHDYSELSVKTCQERGILHMGSCYHVQECSKCKHINAFDS